MNNGDLRERLTEYARALQALEAEITSSIVALANNDLGEFEARVGRQESICAMLVQATAALAAVWRDRVGQDIPGQIECVEAWRELRKRHAALLERKRLYAAVLRQSSKSIALLAALCNSYNGYQPGEAVRCSSSSVSCEI